MSLDKRLLQQVKRARFDLALTVGAGLLTGILTVWQARYLSRVISLVFLEGQSLSEVQPLLIGLFFIGLARAGLAWSSEVTAARLAGRVKTGLHERLFAHLAALGPAYTRGERSGELSNTLIEGVETLDAYFSQYLPQLALAALVPLTILVFVLPLDLLSGLVLLLTAPLIPVFMFLIGSLADALTRKQWTSLSRMSAHFLDVLQGLTTLKLFGRSQAQAQTIGQITGQFRQATMSVLRVAFLSAMVLEMVATISTAVVAVEVGLRLLYARLSFEGAFFVLLLAPEFYLPLRMLGTRFHARTAAITTAKRIFEILDFRPAISNPCPEQSRREQPATSHQPPATSHQQQAASNQQSATSNKQRATSNRQPATSNQQPATSNQQPATSSQQPATSNQQRVIRFEDIYYTYDEGQRPALNGVSFQIAPGQKVALVGPSGAGKSTLAHLLLRFIEPEGGQLTLDGTPLPEIPLPAWRAQVAWVPQHPYLFNASVAENIRLGCPEASLAEVTRAARQTHAHEFIRALPQGYDTLIGERGARLSGGQAQRVALARAFLKDAPLLILDEATSNLDPEHEALIQEATARLTENRTTLIIAHRLNTVYRADQIVVLEEGKVTQTGTHQSLMEQKGLYRRLVTAGAPTNDKRATSNQQPYKLRNQVFSEKPGFWKQPATSNQQPATSNQQPAASSHSLFVRLLKLAAPYWPWMALSATLGFATIGSSLGLMATSAFIIASAALHPSIAELQVAIVGVRFFGIARGVFRYLERYVSHHVTFRLLARLRIWFYQALEPLAPARLMQYRSGDLLARAVADIERLEHFYVRVIAPPVVAALVGLLMWAFMSSFDLNLAVALAAFLLLAGLGLPLLTQLLGHGPGRRLVTVRSELNAALIDGIQGLADLVAFGQERAQLRRVQTLNRELIALQERMAWINGLQSALGNWLASLATLAILALAIPLANAGRLDGVYLAVLVLAALSSFEAVQPLPLAAQYLESNLEAARRLFEIVDAPAVVPSTNITNGANDTNLVIKANLCHPCSSVSKNSVTAQGIPCYDLIVKDVRFRYAPGEPLALDGVSFNLPQGGRLAIVGPSGAGKSTLVNLLLRFWDYQEGQILLGERELREYDQEDLRRSIGVVAQDTYLFNATIRENLLIARPGASQADLERVTRQAQLHEFIRSLPQGYDTWTGEHGLRLSGGERQRLAIARALLKGAPILILDEATANLDPLTEREVIRAIHSLMEGRTTLIITHRLVGLEIADEIVVLRAGQVVERGRHEELLQLGGLYRRMWELQNQVLVTGTYAKGVLRTIISLK